MIGENRLPKVYFLKNKQAKNLKTPIKVNIPDAQRETERRLQEYIIQACMYKMPRLLPFIIENNSMIQLAKHLFLHNSGSAKSLENYTRGILSFCGWLSITPDGIINQCVEKNQAPKLIGIAKIERQLDDYGIFLQDRNLSSNSIINSL
jgi:hypothetical protein